MDIWQKMYEQAQALYQPQEVSDFVYAKHVVAAVEAEDGQIFTGFCMEGTCGVFHLCASHQFFIKVMCRYSKFHGLATTPLKVTNQANEIKKIYFLKMCPKY